MNSLFDLRINQRRANVLPLITGEAMLNKFLTILTLCTCGFSVAQANEAEQSILPIKTTEVESEEQLTYEKDKTNPEAEQNILACKRCK